MTKKEVLNDRTKLQMFTDALKLGIYTFRRELGLDAKVKLSKGICISGSSKVYPDHVYRSELMFQKQAETRRRN